MRVLTLPSSATQRRRNATWLTSLILLALLLVMAVINVAIGARPVSVSTLWQALSAYDSHNFDHRIIVGLRLLRLAGGALTGAALGLAGVLLQTIVRNPIGEPHILGLNAGAALAVVVTTALSGSLADTVIARPLIAAGGAALLFSLIITLACAGRSGPTALKITLCGVALSGFASALSAAILILDEQTLLDLRIWLAGDLAGLNYAQVAWASLPALAGALLALGLGPRLNALALGDAAARGLGVNVLATRCCALVAAALLCGAAVSVAGPIGFIALVAPHIVRRFVSNDLRLLMPLAALTGAILLLLADVAARTLIAPRELATGVMTVMAGAPVFIWIVARYFR